MYAYVSMLKLDSEVKRFDRLEPVLLGDLGLKEREHLQECICKSPDAFFDELDENLLILGTEVAPSDIVGDRIDIFALDSDGTSVIIELKRGSNKWQLLQALAYAAMISKWGVGEEFLSRREISAKQEAIKDFVESETSELNRSQRVIMVAEAFDYEVPRRSG